MAYLMLVILLVFPFIVLLIWYSALQTIFRLRTATLSRHALDLIEAAAISVILYIGFMRLPAEQAAFQEVCMPAKGARKVAVCTGVAETVSGLHFRMVLLNLCMFLAPMLKYKLQGDTTPKDKAA